MTTASNHSHRGNRSSRASARRWALASIIALAAVWMSAPGTQLPLYDGVGFPDEPYRWVIAPPGVTNAALKATEINLQVRLPAGGNPDDIQAQSAEQGPQIALWILAGGLPVAAATPVMVHAAPVPPPVPPAGGAFFSNIYRITASSADGPVALSPQIRPAAAVFLRGLQATSARPQLELLDRGIWRPVTTQRTGQDIWGGYITQFGDYALIVPKGTSMTRTVGPSTPIRQPAAGPSTVPPLPPGAAASSGWLRVQPLLYGMGILLTAASLLALLVRRSRTRRTTDHPEQGP